MLVIKNLEKELAQEEEIRRNKAEYDQLAAVINQQKTREESLRWVGKHTELHLYILKNINKTYFYL